MSMAQRLGLDVEMHEVEWGKGIPLDNLEARLKADSAHEIKAVLATHNEKGGKTSDMACVNYGPPSHPFFFVGRTYRQP
ncbi:MAG: hypothetical protein H0A75_07170 [Candidatus Methanofishera endochildressiae]|uniref:Uncharacterized protein n=1 Tax=Candidatus Methanofishera endochildressiae TaxID=2738884 RepID=A0A7Z0MPB0_9GAMM|nr:hypothetical protein [Candidatus Methanofishera endochildressiae]